MIEKGIEKIIKTFVEPSQTALTVGSGSLEVFATPSMIALMEKASALLAQEYLDDTETTVGTKVNISHVAASLVGDEITVISKLVDIDKRRLSFYVKAMSGDKLLGEGEHERFIINSEKFMNKLRENK